MSTWPRRPGPILYLFLRSSLGLPPSPPSPTALWPTTPSSRVLSGTNFESSTARLWAHPLVTGHSRLLWFRIERHRCDPNRGSGNRAPHFPLRRLRMRKSFRLIALLFCCICLVAASGQSSRREIELLPPTVFLCPSSSVGTISSGLLAPRPRGVD